MNRVQLDELTLVNFRNIQKALLSPSPRFNVISGHNGMGKTNLVEAVYLLGALRSFRTSKRSELIFHDFPKSRVCGVFGSVHAGLKCDIDITDNSRTVTVDGKRMSASGHHFQMLPMVLFHPQVMELVQGGPDARRRFVDRALFQANGAYPGLFRTYTRVVANRNRILRDGCIDRRSLLPFDTQLADIGAQMVAMRRAFIDSMQPFFNDAVSAISDGQLGKLVYQPKIEGNSEAFLLALENRFQRDCARKYTTGGPHSDDVLFLLNGRDAKKFASQGQQRTLVLSAKIAETRALTQSTGKIPLLLFDDVSSELDRRRNRHLFDFLQGMGGQVFITTTHRDYIHIEGERSDFSVTDGGFLRLD
ncbi:MAG: DNA replication/repair protein RecF [Deltaproteobacteria bacterium]|nr:DNA replication/repair protein RecF [Deltaproteobacteria bacterium]